MSLSACLQIFGCIFYVYPLYGSVMAKDIKDLIVYLILSMSDVNDIEYVYVYVNACVRLCMRMRQFTIVSLDQ